MSRVTNVNTPLFLWIKKPASLLILAFFVSALLKLSILKVGAPFITIDDNTAFQGGFLVWFGQAPPQRMFLESWVYGLSCIITYLTKMMVSGNSAAVGINLIPDAYRDFYGNPDTYVHVYRSLMIVVDLATAFLVYLVSRQVLGSRWQGWAAVLPAIMFLFSFNTYWCNVVARPDTLVVFFVVAGLYFYYRSEFGLKQGLFLISAVCLGLAAGMKLHGAFFAIFIVVDLFRIYGIRHSLSHAVKMTGVSFFFFCFASGSVFADPLTYIKLRLLNVRDDASPWIAWGDQLLVVMRGAGWVVVPFVMFALWIVVDRRKDREVDQELRSVVFQAICWLVLFASIRQLRAYWMLPALPLFYMAAVYAVSSLKSGKIAAVIAGVFLFVLAGQSIAEVRELKSIEFSQVRDWVCQHAEDKTFLVFGYDSLLIPNNSAGINKKVSGLQNQLNRSRDEGLSFTHRHIKDWEERSQLMLYDMLEYRNEPGFEYYGIHNLPQDLPDLNLNDMDFIIVQKGYPVADFPEAYSYLNAYFELTDELTGPGGGSSGLVHHIYQRKNLQ